MFKIIFIFSNMAVWKFEITVHNFFKKFLKCIWVIFICLNSLYWSIVDLQCCISFCYIAMWFMYKSFLTLRSHGLQHGRLPCLSLSPAVCSNSCSFSWWCHPAISSSVAPFSPCPQSFPVSGFFPICQFYLSGGQRIGASASVLPMNIQDWFPLGLTGFISLLS